MIWSYEGNRFSRFTAYRAAVLEEIAQDLDVCGAWPWQRHTRPLCIDDATVPVTMASREALAMAATQIVERRKGNHGIYKKTTERRAGRPMPGQKRPRAGRVGTNSLARRQFGKRTQHG